MRTSRGAVLGLVLSAGMMACSNAYDSAALQLHYEPSKLNKFTSENGGVAVFSEGLEIRSVAGKLPEADEKHLEALLPQALELAKQPALTGRISSARAGTITQGAVFRFEVRAPPVRQLIYVIPRPARFVMVQLTVSDHDDGRMEAQFEQSLSTLRFQD